MHTYRVELELRSGLGTPLAADTLWGHLCWGMRYQQGVSALEDWLNQYDSGSPPLVLSDPFPQGYLPRPALAPQARSAQPPKIEEADIRKKRDKISWISESAWSACVNAVSADSIARAAMQSAVPDLGQEMAVTHAGVNRLTGGTAQEDGGLLFTTSQTYFAEARRFTVWARSPASAATVQQWFEQGLAGGYGRDASSGLGYLMVLKVAAESLPEAKTPNAVMILGPTVPRPNDPSQGWFQLGIRAGRVGGEFAVGQLPNGSTERQKHPVRCLLAGTVLHCDQRPLWIGRVLRGVHAWSELRHYGVGLTLGIQLSSSNG